jgi:hypothetical protein
MRKTILTFGLISGLIASLMMVITIPIEDKLKTHSYILGYTTIILSCMLIYFGVRSYRDNVAGGRITFARAFGVGICIALISCLCYVVTWEILYFNFMHDFMDKYAAQALDKARAAGATQAALAAQAEQFKHFKQLYENPLYNAAITFIEPFPVALVITLISAAILRKQPKAAEPLPAV